MQVLVLIQSPTQLGDGLHHAPGAPGMSSEPNLQGVTKDQWEGASPQECYFRERAP